MVGTNFTTYPGMDRLSYHPDSQKPLCMKQCMVKEEGGTGQRKKWEDNIKDWNGLYQCILEMFDTN